jgi:predicted DCC family thiol-disulfide oxidoreductase YuxK
MFRSVTARNVANASIAPPPEDAIHRSTRITASSALCFASTAEKRFKKNRPGARVGKTKIFVDGNCVVCDFEISHYKRIAPDSFDIIDISNPSFDAAAFGLTSEAVNKHLHVQTPEGEMKKGVDAFAHIWSRIPKYRFANRLVKLPGFNQLAKLGYAGFAEIRPWLPKKQ